MFISGVTAGFAELSILVGGTIGWRTDFSSLLITPIIEPTWTTSPSLNKHLIKTPSNGDGISLSTLSVAISKTV